MDKRQREKAETILYFLEKEAARDSLNEFFSEIGLEYDDWKDFKETLVRSYGLDGSKLYISV